MEEGVSGRVDVVLDTNSLGDSFAELGFAGTQFSDQSKNKRVLFGEVEMFLGEVTAELDGFGGGVRGKTGGRVGEKDLSLAENGRIIKGSVDDSTGGTISKFPGIEEEGDKFLLGESCIFAPVGERVGFFFATSVGTGGGNWLTVFLNEGGSKGIAGETHAKCSGCGFESWINQLFRVRNDSDGAREEVEIEILGNSVKGYILFGHRLIGDGNTDLTVTVAFVS